MTTYLTWPLRAAGFTLHFLWLLVLSNLAVSRDIITPGSSIEAGIVRLPLRCRTDLEITMLSNLISLTPGTLTLGVQNNPPVIYVHSMYSPDPEAVRHDLYDLESRMLRAMRRDGQVGPVPTPSGGPQ